MPGLKERVRERRQALGMSQFQLAEKIGVSQERISQLELGKGKSIRHPDALAKALGVSACWLVFGVVQNAETEADPQFIEVARTIERMSARDRQIVRLLLEALGRCTMTCRAQQGRRAPAKDLIR
ncbi:MAG: helix-turn-helix transcriptional regulator [Gammaproteobacteria bacterium]